MYKVSAEINGVYKERTFGSRDKAEQFYMQLAGNYDPELIFLRLEGMEAGDSDGKSEKEKENMRIKMCANDLGMSEKEVKSYFSGKKIPVSLEDAERIAFHKGCSVEDIWPCRGVNRLPETWYPLAILRNYCLRDHVDFCQLVKYTGVPESTMYRIFQGKTKVSNENRRKIAKIFGVDPRIIWKEEYEFYEENVNLKGYLKRKEMTVGELSALSGVSKSMIYKIGDGLKRPSHSTAEALARALEVPISQFFELIQLDG